MTESETEPNARSYVPPILVVHGDLRSRHRRGRPEARNGRCTGNPATRRDYRINGLPRLRLGLRERWPLPGRSSESRDLDTDVVFRRGDSRCALLVIELRTTLLLAYAYRAERLRRRSHPLHMAGAVRMRALGRWERRSGRTLGRGHRIRRSRPICSVTCSRSCCSRRASSRCTRPCSPAPDGAIGILGDSGYGKSTLAAALIEAGLPLLTDDLLVLLPEGDDLMAQPGTPATEAVARDGRPVPSRCAIAADGARHREADLSARASPMDRRRRIHSRRSMCSDVRSLGTPPRGSRSGRSRRRRRSSRSPGTRSTRCWSTPIACAGSSGSPPISQRRVPCAFADVPAGVRATAARGRAAAA